jgi:hypothetical protein
MRYLIALLPLTLPLYGGGENNKALESFAAGAVAGAADTYITQPFTYWKNRRQLKLPLENNPRFWWRGAPVTAASLIPSTAVQNSITERLLSAMEPNCAERKDWQNIIAATSSGVVTALGNGPAEYVMLQQQNSGKSMRAIVQEHGLLARRGMAPTIIREGGYAGGIFGVQTVLKRRMRQHLDNESLIALTAAVTAGAAISALTNPADIIKTRMQADHANNPTMRRAALGVFSQHGMRGFWRGNAGRTASIMVTALVIDQVKERICS